jgi:hypothetical protein
LIVVCVQVRMLYWTPKLFHYALKYKDIKCKNYNIIKEVSLVKVMKDNRGSKSCWSMNGIQKRVKKLQLSKSYEFWKSMGSKRPSWIGTLGILDFALNENFKECGVVVMCQCSREIPCQNMPKLKNGEWAIFWIRSIIGCPTQDHDNNCERGLKRFNSLECFNLMLLQLLC